MASAGAASRIPRYSIFDNPFYIARSDLQDGPCLRKEDPFEYEIREIQYLVLLYWKSAKKRIFFFYFSEKKFWRSLRRSETFFKGKDVFVRKDKNLFRGENDVCFFKVKRISLHPAITLSQFMKTKTRRNFRRALCSANYSKRTQSPFCLIPENDERPREAGFVAVWI